MFQIKPDKKETENKTIRFPVSLIEQIEQVIEVGNFHLSFKIKKNEPKSGKPFGSN